MHPDGTGVSGFYGNRVPDPGTFVQPRAIPGTSTVICMMPWVAGGFSHPPWMRH
jgi:hypothetical protein